MDRIGLYSIHPAWPPPQTIHAQVVVAALAEKVQWLIQALQYRAGGCAVEDEPAGP